MFKSVARAQILVPQVGEVRDGGSRRMGVGAMEEDEAGTGTKGIL